MLSRWRCSSSDPPAAPVTGFGTRSSSCSRRSGDRSGTTWSPDALTSRPEMAAFLERLQSAVPQGQVLDTSVTTVRAPRLARALRRPPARQRPRARAAAPPAEAAPRHADDLHGPRRPGDAEARVPDAVATRHRPGRRHRRRRDARHRRRRQLRLPDRGARHRAHAQPDRRARQLAARRPRRRARLPDRARQAADLRPAARPHDARAHGARLSAAVARARLRALPRLRGVRAPRHDRPGHRRGDPAARCRLQHPFPRLSPAGRRAGRRVDPRPRDAGPRWRKARSSARPLDEFHVLLRKGAPS